MTEGLAEDTDDLGEPAAAGADDQRWPTTDVVAVILLAGVAVAAVCCFAAAVWVALDTTASDGESGFQRFGQVGLSFAQFVDIGVVLLLVTTAALWWQVGVVLDRLDEDDVVPERSLARLALLLQVTLVLLAVTAVAAVAGLLGVVAQTDVSGAPAILRSQVLVEGGVVVAALAGCAAAHRAVRSMRQDLSSRRPTAR